MRNAGKKSIGYGVAAVAVGLGAAMGAGPARAATAPASAPAHPTAITLPSDQAEHPGFQNEWYYVVGHLKAHGHEFGYEVQIIPHSNINGVNAPLSNPEAIVAITDVTTGKYYTQTFRYAAGQGTFATDKLDAQTPNASLSGPLNAMHLQAKMPAGTLDLNLNAKGPTIYNDGTGLVPFLAGTTHYYSLPRVSTTGTLVENGHQYNVTGTSWLDHQWGNWNWQTLSKWTWMGIRLSNGTDIDLFDQFVNGTEDHYATVLEPNGTEQVVSVKPLAAGTSGFVTSPVTGQRFGSQWQVKIPALHTTPNVTASPKLQEVQANGGIFEGDSTVVGSYHGKAVTGQAYAEQIGNWHP